MSRRPGYGAARRGGYRGIGGGAEGQPLPGAFALYLPAGLTTTTWADSSGNARNLSVVAGAGTLGSLDGKPTFKPASVSPMAVAAGAWTVGNPSTIYLVAKTGPSLAAARTAMDAGQGAASAGRIFMRTDTVPNWEAGATTTVDVAAAATSTWYGLITIVQGDTNDFAYLNNFVTPAVSATLGNGTMTGISLGASITPAQTWTGEIAGCMIYAAVHTQAQREATRDFIKSHWPTMAGILS